MLARNGVAAPSIDVNKLARECDAACPNDPRAATSMLFERLKRNPAAYAQVADPLVTEECWQIISRLKRKARRAVWTAPNYQKGLDDAKSNVTHLSRANRSLLEDFPMPNGSRLGDADRTYVLEAGEFYGKQSRDMGKKSSFLMAIAGAMRGSQLVRDAFTPEAITKLHQRVVSGEAA